MFLVGQNYVMQVETIDSYKRVGCSGCRSEMFPSVSSPGPVEVLGSGSSLDYTLVDSGSLTRWIKPLWGCFQNK